MAIEKREIAKAIVLSVVTCGIYSIFWFIKMTDEINELSGLQNQTSGGKAFLFTLITCGIYGIYWSYQQGEKLYAIKTKQGIAGENKNLIYLILTIVGLGIITYALIQQEINDLV